MTDLRTRAADILEPHVTGRFKARQRAENMAEQLDFHGLLGAATADAQEKTATLLQCQMSWPTAERAAAELHAAGLLSEAASFGYSDYIRDLTGPANAAAEAGLIELKGAWRRWALTAEGLAVLARAEQESQR